MNGTTSPPTLPALSEVLIAGAGPTGLTLAVALTTDGVPCTIIDALPHGANSSRAAVVHARTLEVLHPLNIADPSFSPATRPTSTARRAVRA
jgi:2-polyprenyl-6-methoxyphenol hydroxylase-like FAD-dependent oxidoreductase